MFAKDQALNFLAQGLKQSVVAGILGVEESYISQLMAHEDFAAELAEAKSKLTAKDTAYDDKLDSATEQALDRIESKLPFANLQQSLQAFKVLDGARRRKQLNQSGSEVGTAITVNILLPTSIAPRYLQNQSGEIVEVEGQTMVSATPKNLEDLVQRRKQLQLDTAAPASRVEAVEQTIASLERSDLARAHQLLPTIAPVKKHVRKIGLLTSEDL